MTPAFPERCQKAARSADRTSKSSAENPLRPPRPPRPESGPAHSNPPAAVPAVVLLAGFRPWWNAIRLGPAGTPAPVRSADSERMVGAELRAARRLRALLEAGCGRKSE